MKLTNFINLLATAFVVSAAAGVAIGCQQEPVGPERLEGDIEIALQMEDLATKVDIADKTGAGTWTTGDEIAVHVTETGVGTGYRDYTINAAGSYHFTMNANITLDGYVISPAIMCYYADPAPLGSTPRVIYRTEYSMSGRDLTSPTFSYVPMMAVNDDELLYFYHVGGLVRLAMQGVPEGTNKVVVTFDGMTNITGTCTVSNPGTVRAAATITSGSGNVVTFTNVNRTAANLYLNVPIPTGNYSALTSITVEAFQDATSKGIVRINQRGRWATVRHGHGRVIPVSFTSNPISGVRLSSTADVTLWKSQKVQRTAVPYDAYDLEYPDATVVWSSDTPAVATVDPTTGLVNAVDAGSATITATATPTIGGTPYSESYNVYVNAVTGISVTPNVYAVLEGKTINVTATLTNTNNGTPSGIPADLVVSWTSSSTANVTVATGTSSVVRVDATHMTATVVVNGEAEGSSTLTASISGYGVASDSDNTINCEVETSITFPGNGVPYKFRGYWIHPGFLFEANDGTKSLQGANDPLYILQHYYYDSHTTKFDGSEGTAWKNRCYFNWNELDAMDGSTNSTVSFTLALNDAYGNHTWRIPTGTSSGEWNKIFYTSPSYSITINKDTKTNSGYNYVKVTVDLQDATIANGASANYHYVSDGDKYRGLGSDTSAGNAAGGNRYQSGYLLIPDGARIACSRIKTFDSSFSPSTNCLNWNDLKTLTNGGCVFMPISGYVFDSSTWYSGGGDGFYWTSSGDDSTNAYSLYFIGGGVTHSPRNKTYYYFPVRLICN